MSVKNFKSWPIIFAMGLILGILFTIPSFAGLGKIAGTVTDEETGEALAGAQVMIVGTTMGAATNAQGQYFILNVPPGTYSLRVTFMGYATKEITNVRSQLDVTTMLDIKLKQTVIEGEIVTIVAERPVVDKTMTATKISFSGEHISNVLPVTTLNEILQTSVTVQAMRGATKRGVGYMIDGIKVTDVLWPTGGGSMGHTNVKHDDTPIHASAPVFEDQGNSALSMVRTAGYQLPQSAVQEANVIAGTVNAEYSSSGGVINLATKDGSNKYSAKLFLRSSIGGLKHAGPNLYNGRPPANVFDGKTAAEHYFAYRDKLLSSPDVGNQERGKLLDWTPGKYEYGEDPRINAELNVSGPLTSKGNFFVFGQLLNDHGRFPGEFQRQITGSVKLNYNLTPSNKLTLMTKIDDGGKLLGWKNRQFTYMYMFFLEGQPINDKLATTNYLKWIKTFNPTTFLESTVSFVTTARTYGYQPVNDKLVYKKYGGKWLILDSAEKVDKYIINTNTRIFTAVPGNDQYHQIDDFGTNQIRFGRPGYLYENFETGVLTAKMDLTSQINFNHQLKAGGEFNYVNIDWHQEGATVTGVDPKFPIEVQIWNHKPWNGGIYLQDRIEYSGIIVNAGIRLDGYNYAANTLTNPFDPLRPDSLPTGQKVWKYVRTKKAKTHFYFSPRLGISHPITENAAMHYSWGIYTTPQAYLTNYGAKYVHYISLPSWTDGDMAPEKATAYEIGVNVGITKDIAFDLTAYYRDTRNSSTTSYSIQLLKSSGGGLGSYILPWGYRDSRGFELNLYKRPTPERYFGVIGLSGNLSLSFSYDKPAIQANNLVTDLSARNSLRAGTLDEDWDFNLRYQWPSYSRGFNYWRGKAILIFDFPFDINLSTVTTYNSPPYFTKTLDVKNLRYEETYQGDYFLQIDARLLKYFKFGKYRAGAFVEALNLFNRLNVYKFDDYLYNTMYEKDRIPWGPLWRPTDSAGNPFAGIARELYAGIEFYF